MHQRPGPEEELLILSLDTTTRDGSVAVVRDEKVLAELAGDPATTHGQRLPGDISRALESAGVRIQDVELLAVAAGPGSFTGLRVGIATVQGLAFARGLKIVPVSTLEALARDAVTRVAPRSLVAPWADAQRGQVFAALYAPQLDRVVRAPSSATPAETLDMWREAVAAEAVAFAGDGAVKYSDLINSTLAGRATIVRPVPRLAVPIARLAAREPHRAVPPHAVVPIYVRRSDAELARERLKG